MKCWPEDLSCCVGQQSRSGGLSLPCTDNGIYQRHHISAWWMGFCSEITKTEMAFRTFTTLVLRRASKSEGQYGWELSHHVHNSSNLSMYPTAIPP